MPQLRQLMQDALPRGLPRIEVQMLLLHACGRDPLDRAWLAAHDTDDASPEQESALNQSLARRIQGEPIAYILGFKEFFGLRLDITPDVLDPRDDTETLVNWALEQIAPDQPVKLLDLGTGSGAIALAIQSQRPLAQITATDASPQALRLAQSNAAKQQFPVRFVLADAKQTNWFAPLGDARYEIIVSNPPYIAEADPHLAALQHEPAMALTSGAEGLDAIRSIIAHAADHLEPGGWLLLEHGYNQAEAIQDLFAAQGYSRATTRLDLAGVARCTGAQKRSLN
jgi:release factor glutamine methyltransferase